MRNRTSKIRFILVSELAAHLLATRATGLGPHSATATMRFVFVLRHHSFAERRHSLRADATPVTAWLKARGIRVVETPNPIFIRTEAPTRVYEKALHIRIDDYRMDGRSFYDTRDKATLPGSIAARVTGILWVRNDRAFSRFRVQGWPFNRGKSASIHSGSQVAPPTATGIFDKAYRARLDRPSTFIIGRASLVNSTTVAVSYGFCGCHGYLGKIEVGQTPQSVTVILYTVWPPLPRQPIACPALCTNHAVRFRLDAPLGNRRLVDGSTGKKIPLVKRGFPYFPPYYPSGQ